MDKPGEVVNPARGQLNQGKLILPCPRSRLRIWSCETGSAVSSRVSLLISILWLDLELTYGIPPDFRGGVHLFIYSVKLSINQPKQSVRNIYFQAVGKVHSFMEDIGGRGDIG